MLLYHTAIVVELGASGRAQLLVLQLQIKQQEFAEFEVQQEA